MKTYKELVITAAHELGCRSRHLEPVWEIVRTYSVPLSAKSLVFQVANAMESIGLSPDTASINAIASRL